MSEIIQLSRKDLYDHFKSEFDDLLDQVDKDTLEDTSKKKWRF